MSVVSLVVASIPGTSAHAAWTDSFALLLFAAGFASLAVAGVLMLRPAKPQRLRVLNRR